MRQRLSELLDYMDAARDKLLSTVAPVNATIAGIQPRDGQWSVLQNLAHLGIIEQGVARVVARSVEWAKTHGIGPEESDSSILSTLDSYSLENATSKMVAPALVAPTGEATLTELLASLAQSRAALRAAFEAGDGLDLSAVKRQHLSLGELNLYQWGLFVAQHELRHRHQIERTLKDVTERCVECAPIV